MPTNPLPSAARLAAMTSPIGQKIPGQTSARPGLGTAGLGAVSATGAAGATSLPSGAFSDLLLSQLGDTGMAGAAGIADLSGLSGVGATSGLTDLSGLAGSAGMPSLSGLASLSGLSTLPSTAAGVPGVAAGMVPGAVPGADRAIAWAQSMMGRQDWDNLCEQFVEEAYGTSGIYPTAVAAAGDLVTHRGLESLASAPVGALLYFAADDTNQNNGHTAIYLGNGRMVSARPNGVQEEAVDSPYNRPRLLGWGMPTFPSSPRAGRPHSPGAVPGATVAIPSAPVPKAPARLPGLAVPRLPAPSGLASRLPTTTTQPLATPAASGDALEEAASTDTDGGAGKAVPVTVPHVTSAVSSAVSLAIAQPLGALAPLKPLSTPVPAPLAPLPVTSSIASPLKPLDWRAPRFSARA